MNTLTARNRKRVEEYSKDLIKTRENFYKHKLSNRLYKTKFTAIRLCIEYFYKEQKRLERVRKNGVSTEQILNAFR